MRYLLDVNALIALGIQQHQFHSRVSQWLRAREPSSIFTSSIVEIGFVRIVAQAPIYDLNLAEAKAVLSALKTNRVHPLGFIADANDISSLPPWVNRPGQTTDGHLLNLAKAHDAVLATLDEGIPGAFVIPPIS